MALRFFSTGGVKTAIILAMSTYSVVDAKNGLPGLIDRALAGEDVVITRHGKPVAELRALAAPAASPGPATYAWLRERRKARPGVAVGSVDLLREVYEADNA